MNTRCVSMLPRYGSNNNTHWNARDIIPGVHNGLSLSLTSVTLVCLLRVPLARLSGSLRCSGTHSAYLGGYYPCFITTDI